MLIKPIVKGVIYMCGRFTLFSEFESIVKRFEIDHTQIEEQYQFSYNIAPSHSVVSVISNGDQNKLGFLRWGLIPPWAKDEKLGFKMINARAETLAEKKSFKNAYKNKRCLIIADSFFEWKRINDKKVPMRIKLKNGMPFGMAGLWEAWKSPNGKFIYSCAVITTNSNTLMSPIHNRMPVIIKPENEKEWLNPAITDLNKLNRLLKPYDDREMEAFEVSSAVNSSKHNSPEIIEKTDEGNRRIF